MKTPVSEGNTLNAKSLERGHLREKGLISINTLQRDKEETVGGDRILLSRWEEHLNQNNVVQL